MTFKHKLSRRLAMLWSVLLVGVLSTLAGCDLKQILSQLQGVVVTVSVAPPTPSLQTGQTVQLTATPRDGSGNTLTGKTVTWSSSNAAYAAVNSGGLVTGVAPGTATITASSDGINGTAAISVTSPGGGATDPGTVNDLAVAGVTATSATLSFTEVNDGTGAPASYDIRFAPGTISWGSGTAVSQGTCTVPVAGGTIGATRTCTVLGLATGTAYQFQLVSFRGTLNLNAVFGGLSNVANGTTATSTAPVATVTVSPSSASLVVGSQQQFAASLFDASGNLLTGRSITWTSSNALVATVNGSGLVSGVAAGSVTITATSGGTNGTSSVTVTASSSSSTHEPPGLTLINEQSWDCLGCNGWNYRADYGWSDIQNDPTAPKSPGNVLRAVFPTTMPRDNGPSNNWIFIGNSHDWHELYVAYWIKWGNPWDALDQGAKISFVWAQSGSYIYAVLVPGLPPYHIGMVVGWSPYGYSYGDGGVWHPNVTTTPVVAGQWYFVEEYFKYPTTPGGSDGIMRWWVNGTLNGDFTNVTYPADPGFEQFEFPFTRQATPLLQSYVYVDHTRLSGKQ